MLLVPAVARLAVRAPRDRATRWDRYWSQVRATGDDGDVLWGPAGDDEPARYRALLDTFTDPTLPLIDLGCGSGTLTRALAPGRPHVIGVDHSPHAITLARAQSATTPHVTHHVLDARDTTAAAALHTHLGDATVFIRGVLHILTPHDRRRVAATVQILTGARGAVLLAETNYPGPLLGYLESQGARPTGLPGPLGRAISAGLPRPSRFGTAELADCFPPAHWERLFVDEDATINTVPVATGQPRGTVCAHVAVLRHHP